MKIIDLQKKMVNHKAKAEVDELIKKMRKEDEKPVKGQFEFTEAEGGFFSFAYRIYPGEPIQMYTFVHGEICTVPMGIVKHLNGTNKKIRRYANVEQSANGPIKPLREFDTISRVRFVPYEFLDKAVI
jgi:hypothetical protein